MRVIHALRRTVLAVAESSLEHASLSVDIVLGELDDRLALRRGLKQREPLVRLLRHRILVLDLQLRDGHLHVEVSFEVDREERLAALVVVISWCAARDQVVPLERRVLLAVQSNGLLILLLLPTRTLRARHQHLLLAQRQNLVHVENAQALARKEVQRRSLEVELLFDLNRNY